MRETIVTDWNLVCGDYLMKGHAHLFYSFGYLVGCVFGGWASDKSVLSYSLFTFSLASVVSRQSSVSAFSLPCSVSSSPTPPTIQCSYSSVSVVPSATRPLTWPPILCVWRSQVRLSRNRAYLPIGTPYRAMVGSMLQVPWAMGYALLALIAYLSKSWKTVQVIAAGLHFGAVLLICSLPESPRWLMVKERVNEAEEVIRKACRSVVASLPKIEDCLERRRSPSICVE